MFKLIFKRDIVKKIDDFIDWYLNSFLNLFIDSWIDNIKEIEENYIKIATNFRNNIYSSLKNILVEDIILGKRIWEKQELSIIVSVWNYRLFVDYKEDKNSKNRFIEDIEFYRK